MIGNAVPISLAYEMAKSVKEAIEKASLNETTLRTGTDN